MGTFNPLRVLDFRKRAWKAGAVALATRKASDWHTLDVTPTSAQEATARAVVDAAFRECRVGDLHRVLTELVESAVYLNKDTDWIHVKKARLEEARLLLETISHSEDS